jgi:hypothetical protein
MPLQSKLFSLDHALEVCSKQDHAHISIGAQGDHVSKIQTALFLLDGVSIASSELYDQSYGPSTADAVLAYKGRRNIISRMYQPDNIVGKMTIASMDREVLAIERQIDCLPELMHSVACT